MTAREKAQNLARNDGTAAERAAKLTERYNGQQLTARTIRKARQYRTPALDRIAAALNLKDDPEQGSRS